MASTRRDRLQATVRKIEADAGTRSLAVAYYDYETRSAWSYHGDRWFHAASTIKVPVLVGVMGAVESGGIALGSRVHIRNRFLSVADHQPFRVGSSRDANAEVHAHLGKTLTVEQLCYHMIVTSSNLATNLLVQLVGLERLQESLRELGIRGVELRRGVEDEAAFEQGINNRVTANGLLDVLRRIEEGTAFSVAASAKALEIMHEQEFRSGIPAGVPGGVKVANKTGEISTIAHDCAIVYPPGRKPYAIVVLTEWDARDTGRRSATIARVSRVVYEQLVGPVGEDA
jgi:beta-lactamase class A